jgi:hypothetical protein
MVMTWWSCNALCANFDGILAGNNLGWQAVVTFYSDIPTAIVISTSNAPYSCHHLVVLLTITKVVVLVGAEAFRPLCRCFHSQAENSLAFSPSVCCKLSHLSV